MAIIENDEHAANYHELQIQLRSTVPENLSYQTEQLSRVKSDDPAGSNERPFQLCSTVPLREAENPRQLWSEQLARDAGCVGMLTMTLLIMLIMMIMCHPVSWRTR